MTDAATLPRTHRIVGRYETGRDGPLLLVTAGIHGNEPSGVRALERVFERLQRDRPPLRGSFVGFAGNLPALERDVRFVDRDFNRVWFHDDRHSDIDDNETRQQRELLGAIREEVERAQGRDVFFIDLHTSSAEGPPFVTIGDTVRNRRFAFQFPVPVILGLEEQIDGALLEYLNNLGVVTMGAEVGYHYSPESVDRHEAVLRLALLHADMVDASEFDDLPARRRLLAQASAGIPRVIEVRNRHPIRPGDGFRMEPGFRNFSPIRKGQLLAHDHTGPLVAPEDGLILLPLYQGQGDDGFFTAREVPRMALRVSAGMRLARLDRLVGWLPGVRREARGHRLLVNTRVAWLFPLQVFHLLGFRKVRRVGDVLVVSRRAFDLRPPGRIDL